MILNKMIPLVTTDKLAEVKKFYQGHFDFGLTFDSPMFVGMKARDRSGAEISFMAGEENQPRFSGEGLMLCLEVDDVNSEHDRLRAAGIPIAMPLRDNPWGDRSFSVKDPAGVAVYLFKPIPVAPEFAKYVKEA